MFQFSDLSRKSFLVCTYSAANEDAMYLPNFMGQYTQVFKTARIRRTSVPAGSSRETVQLDTHVGDYWKCS